ncbi:MAG: M56 family metallopeptidase, partial [Phycisphaerae bacterium]|nr:M56 family metallopeptidase [Phycisphaerae bacterium]
MGSFVDSLNQAGAAFCGFTWAMLIQSSVLIAVLYAIDRIIRHKVRAVVRYGVWMLVLVKLILPPTLSLPTGIGYWVSVPAPAQEIRTVESQPVLPVAAKVNSTVNTSSLNAETTPQPFIETSTVTKVQPEIAVPIEAEKVRTLTWHAWMLCAWIAGVIALLGLLFQRLWFVRRLLSQSRPADAAWDELTHACAEQVGLRNPIEVRVSKYLHSPAACGLIRPVILMPKAIEHALSQDRRSAILLHELVHIARADLWVNLIQTLLQVAYFYNPLLWLANAKIRSLREKAVDETVLTKLEDDDAGQYSTTLIDIAEIAFSKPHFSLGLIGVVESKKALAERIKHILGRPMPTSAKVGILGVAAIAVGALVLLPMTKAGTFDWWLHRDRLVAFKSLGNARGSNEQRGRVEHYAKEYEVAIRPHEKLLVFAELYQHGQPMRRLGHKVLDGSSGAQKLSVALEREYLNDEKTKARFSGRVTWGHEVCHFKRSILETQSFFPTDIRGFFQGEEMTRVGDQRFWEGETLMTFVAQPLGGPPRAPNIWMPGYRVSQGLSDGYFILIKMLPLSTLDQLRIQWRRGIDPQLPDGTYLGPDATRAQWQAVADEYVLDIKRMLMRGRMPLPELSVHTKYAFGEPVHI